LLDQLRGELHFLPKEERESAVRYYGEYFEEAGEENHEAVVSGFGSPAELAKKIRNELYNKENFVPQP